MQGFNRYIPPDFDPKQHSTLNAYQGKKHALGARAKDIDKGVLVVRFELPFNIWCGGCENHIGAGVRYNAQKRKVGNYHSTPIFGFRCKCHLCSHWFEIRTDPQNAAYIVFEGAKKQESSWDPESEGGHAVYNTEAVSRQDVTTALAGGVSGTQAVAAGIDPLAAIETEVKQKADASAAARRVAELYAAGEVMADPWEVNRALRGKFREQKREALERQGRDEGVLERYGLDESLRLEELGDVKGEFEAARREAGPVKKERPLGKRLREDFRRSAVSDAFDEPIPKRRVRLREASPKEEVKAPAPVGLLGLGDYGSGSDSD